MCSKVRDLVVAAIDFGTTYSGYAFSTSEEYQTNPLKINAKRWKADEIVSEKTPTSVLFDKDKKFHAFGYKAESKYAQLAEEDKHTGWRYFKHFKLMLMQAETQRLRKNIVLRDDQGQTMRALDVFSGSINYLKTELLEELRYAIKGLQESDIKWVLTVPAIWEDGAKQFMRVAANQAGIPDKQLILALEPEAAAVYCKQIATQRSEIRGDTAELTGFQPGAKFLLLDLGGGTVDSAVVKVEENGCLSDLHQPDGGPWGGMLVDQAFRQFLKDVFGTNSVAEFSEKFKPDELFILRHFELIKRELHPDMQESPRLRIPLSLMDCAMGSQVVRRGIEASIYKNAVELNRDKLVVDYRILADMFTASKQKLIDFIETLFQNDDIRGIQNIILVGGFSDSRLMVQAVENHFKDKNVIVPNEAYLTVLRGAVLYGRQSNEDIIAARQMRFTYGISTAVPILDLAENRPMCKYRRENVFHVFFEAGQRVIPGDTSVTSSFNPTADCIEVYRTKAKNPETVYDEGCFMVGKVMLENFDYNGGAVDVTFQAGNTELEVYAKQRGSNEPTLARFSFLI